MNIFAFATLLSAVLVITSKNPIISLVFLIFTFLNTALYLIITGISYIGISYIILYIGAITVIFLFIIMMINIKLSDITEKKLQYTKNIPLAILIGTLFIYEIFIIVPFTFNNISSLTYLLNILTSLNKFIINLDFSLKELIFINYNFNTFDINFITFTQIQSVGHSLYTYNAILLIILSIILLLALLTPILFSNFDTSLCEGSKPA